MIANSKSAYAYELEVKDREIVRLKERLAVAMEALQFYADPSVYHAIAFIADPPCGCFLEDFSHDDDYGRPMPGKCARAALERVKDSA